MSQGVIIPVAKALYLCDGHIGFPNQKTDLMGLFSSIRTSSYPHTQKSFVVFAQLVGGLGKVPFWIDIRFAPADQLVRNSNVNHLNFPNRETVVQMVMTIQNVTFPQPGIYLVELFCDNQWVADTTLKLR